MQPCRILFSHLSAPHPAGGRRDINKVGNTKQTKGAEDERFELSNRFPSCYLSKVVH